MAWIKLETKLCVFRVVVALIAAIVPLQAFSQQLPTTIEQAPELRSTTAELPASPIENGRYRPWYTPLSSDGLLAVRVRAILPEYVGTADAKGSFVSLVRRGAVVQTNDVGTGGIAQLPAVVEGRQSLLITGPHGVAAIGVYISNRPGIYPPLEAPPVNIGLVPRVDLPAISQFLASRPSSDAVLGEEIEASELTGVHANRRTVFSLLADGSVLGRLVLPGEEVGYAIADASIAFIRNGQILVQAETNDHGVFRITDAEIVPGYVSMVVMSSRGYVVTSVEIHEASVPREAIGDVQVNGQFVELQDVTFQGDNGEPEDGEAANSNTGTDVIIEPATLDSLPVFQQFLAQAPPPVGAPPFPPGSPAGGPFAGGGVGAGAAGGSPGLGALFAGLGGVALGAAIADDNNNVPPVSPVTP